MRQENYDYFMNELKSGREIKLMSFSHNTEWPSLIKFVTRYPNLKLDYFGCDIGYCDFRRDFYVKDYDVIAYYDNKIYDKKEFANLLDIANKVSKKSQKRVTVSYFYYIPFSERKDGFPNVQFKLVSIINENIKYKECMFAGGIESLFDLSCYTLWRNDFLNSEI